MFIHFLYNIIKIPFFIKKGYFFTLKKNNKNQFEFENNYFIKMFK